MKELLTIIPARMQATRLSGKPMLPIGDKPMIEHVWARAVEADVGPVLIATDSKEIAAHIQKVGGQAIMTGDHHQSGSDRIYEALHTFDPDGTFSHILNLQGDLPLLDPELLKTCAQPLEDDGVDIATLCSPIVEPDELNNPNVVKLVGSRGMADDHVRALYFTRAPAPTGDGPHFHHIGLYAYKRHALEQFVAMPQSTLEKSERLEQLRALEAGMRIDAKIVDTVPFGVDTKEDLQKAIDAWQSRQTKKSK